MDPKEEKMPQVESVDPTKPTTPPVQPEEKKEPIHQVPEESVAKPRKVIVLYPTVILLILISVVAGYLGYQNYQLRRQLSKQVIKTPAPQVPQETPLSTPDPTTGWQVFRDNDLNFEFKYPSDLIIRDLKTNSPSPTNKLYIAVYKEKIDELDEDLPSNRGRTDALEDEKLLSEGEFGKDLGMSVEKSKKVVKLDSLNGKVSVGLSGLDICSLWFSKNLVFYKDGYRVSFTLIGPDEDIKKDNPTYFRTYEKGCGDLMIWKEGSITTFYQDLDSQKTGPISTKWYQLFDQILSTFKVNN